MTIRITDPGEVHAWADLHDDGRVEVLLEATIDVDGHSYARQIGVRWEGAPRRARIAQTLSLHGWAVRNDLREIGVEPSGETIVRTGGNLQEFQISAPGGAAHIYLDAIHSDDGGHRELAYASDAHYLAQRTGAELLFFDAPYLWFRRELAFVQEQANLHGVALVSVRLVGQFQTHILVGETRRTTIAWARSWQRGTGELEVNVSEGPYLLSTPDQAERDAIPTSELHHLIAEWQRGERRGHRGPSPGPAQPPRRRDRAVP